MITDVREMVRVLGSFPHAADYENLGAYATGCCDIVRSNSPRASTGLYIVSIEFRIALREQIRAEALRVSGFDESKTRVVVTVDQQGAFLISLECECNGVRPWLQRECLGKSCFERREKEKLDAELAKKEAELAAYDARLAALRAPVPEQDRIAHLMKYGHYDWRAQASVPSDFVGSPRAVQCSECLELKFGDDVIHRDSAGVVICDGCQKKIEAGEEANAQHKQKLIAEGKWCRECDSEQKWITNSFGTPIPDCECIPF